MVFKRLIVVGIIFVFLILLFIFLADHLISSGSKKYIYDNAIAIPENKVGLLLGTSKYNRNGNINPYYKYRIDAALELYKAGKIDGIVVSGDNSRKSYNEPAEMTYDLVMGGIPSEKVYSDYAGFRTLDSIIRMNEIFGQKKFTIISQRFHNERAIYIAQQQGLEVVGFNAQDVSSNYGFKTQLRERFARVKVFIDLVINKQPKFLGEPIRIE
ncbi:MAG: YdcF family protein [Bacteroidales bacterium]|nr:YdcF family protein [Bacteroidales bacterium]